MTAPAGGVNLGRFTIRASTSIHPRRRPGRSRSLRSALVGAVTVACVLGLTGQAVGAAPAGTSGSRYQVRRGDTLSDIAARYGISVSALASANGISNVHLVYAGNWLTLPGGSGGSSSSSATAGTHVVTAGQTLSAIAAKYGVSVSALASANNLRDRNYIVAGQRLTIPSAGGGSVAAAPSGGSGGGGGSANLPSRLRSHPERLALIPVFDKWARAYGVPADLLKATTYLESGWQQGVISHTKAVGIGQLMPDTVTFVCSLIGVRLNPYNPEDNIRMSAKYLAWLLGQVGGSSSKALAAYYQGLNALRKYGMYGETVAYVNGVQALRWRFG